MSRWRVAMTAAVPALLLATDATAQVSDGESFARDIVANVARVRAGNATGFGFIVGLGPRELIVATAYHTLEQSADAPMVCFPLNGETCASSAIVSIADAVGNLPALDLAFLAVPYPDGLDWRPDVQAEPADGEAVRSIGRGMEWYVPDRAGQIAGRDPAARTVRYTGLTVAEGVSGAPIVSEAGIVAMHVESLGQVEGANGIALSAIRERLIEQARRRWILVQRDQCSDLDAQRHSLDGRSITLHFDAASPDNAMGAAALLLCLGAHVGPRPVWDATSWPGESITYGSGDLRLGRTAQTVLARFGALDTRLGDPVGDLEIWIR